MMSWFSLYEVAQEVARDRHAEADRDRLARATTSAADLGAEHRVAGPRQVLPVRARCWTVRARRLSITITLGTEIH